jgi:hypothetical protein
VTLEIQLAAFAREVKQHHASQSRASDSQQRAQERQAGMSRRNEDQERVDTSGQRNTSRIQRSQNEDAGRPPGQELGRETAH